MIRSLLDIALQEVRERAMHTGGGGMFQAREQQVQRPRGECMLRVFKNTEEATGS